jgi:hypothetical protein
MQNEEVSESEKIKRQLVKLKWELIIPSMVLQLLIFALLINVVSDTVRKDSKNWKQDYRVGYYSSNEQKMIDNLEQKMLSEMKTIQDQITELKVQEGR